MKKDIRRTILCTVAGLLMALNYRTFVHTGGLLPGGFAGLTILIQNIVGRFSGFEIPYSPVYLLLNLFPIVLSYRKIGKKFTVFSCITIILVAFLTDLIPAYVITYDILLISTFGGLINGFAISLCLYAGATSGGTDFISIYVSEKYGVDAWNYIFLFNTTILVIDGFLFGWSRPLYSIIFQFTSTQVLHTLHKRYQKNTLLIVTDHPKEITERISRITMHGATDISAVGSYHNTPRTIVYSVVSGDELKEVVKNVQQVDPDAFINVLDTSKLIGRYHMRGND